jgi:DNA end-binding protein Ku
MAPRAIGSGTISFGLVSIPVKLYSSSVASSEVHFNMLHSKCGSRLKQRYVCVRDNEEVSREDTVKGYEFAKDQYVTFTEEELKAVAEDSTKAIEITEFVPADKVDPLYFDKAYYLGADKGGDRAYTLLRQAMATTGRSALAKYAARGKQYLVLLRAVDGGIVMQQLHYADELRSLSDLDIATVDVKDAELKLAVQFIEQLASDEFRPEQYEDEVKLRLQKAIQKKVEGEEVVVGQPEQPRAQIIDLMEALKASLAQSPGKAKTKARARTKAASKKPARSEKKSKRAGA